MKITLLSKAFLPNVGGIETSSAMMARTWHAAGHDVEVVTAVPDDKVWSEPYRVVRTWSPASLAETIRRADVVAVNGYSRAGVAASALCGRRVVVFHQGYQLICSDGLGFRSRQFHGFRFQDDVRLAFEEGLRQGVRALARVPFDRGVQRWPHGIHHVVPSHHVGKRLKLRNYSLVYQPPNPAVIDAVTELGAPTQDKRSKAYADGDIVFFGRLVFEKGCDVLIDAYGAFRRELIARGYDKGRIPRLVLYGQGPEQPLLDRLATAPDVVGWVELRPFLSGRDLARAAREASVVVVPSTWEEPGATIAVELFACGAAVIASETGAQGEIFRRHGRLFPNGSVEGLARSLRDHFTEAPVYPQPVGDEPWLLPSIQKALIDLVREN